MATSATSKKVGDTLRETINSVSDLVQSVTDSSAKFSKEATDAIVKMNVANESLETSKRAIVAATTDLTNATAAINTATENTIRVTREFEEARDAVSKILTDIRAAPTAISTALTAMQGDITRAIQGVADRIPSVDISSIQTKITQIDGTIQQLQESIVRSNERLTKMYEGLETAKTQMEEKQTRLQTALQEVQTQSDQTVVKSKTYMDQLKTQYDQAVENYTKLQTQYTEAYRQQAELINTRRQEIIAEIDNRLKQFTDFIRLETDRFQPIAKSIQESQTSLQTLQSQIKTTDIPTLQGLLTSINTSLQTFFEEVGKKKEEIRGESSQAVSKIREEVERISGELEVKLADASTSEITSLIDNSVRKTVKASIEEQLGKVVSVETIQEIKRAIDAQNESIQKELSDQLANIQKREEEMAEEVTQRRVEQTIKELENSSEIQQSAITQKIEEVDQRLDESILIMKGKIGEIAGSTEFKLQQIKDRIEEIQRAGPFDESRRQEILDLIDLSKNINKQLVEMRNETNQTVVVVQESKKGIETSLAAVKKEIGEQVEQITQEINEEIDEKIGQIQTSTSDAFNVAINKLKEETTDIGSKLKDSSRLLNTNLELLRRSTDAANAGIDESQGKIFTLQKQIEAMISVINKVIAGSNTQIRSQLTGLEQQIDRIMQQTTQTIDSNISRYTQQMEQVKKDNEATLKVSNETQTAIQGQLSKITEIQGTISTNVQERQNELLTKLSEVVTKEKELTNQIASSGQVTETRLVEQFDKMQTRIGSISDSIVNGLSNKIEIYKETADNIGITIERDTVVLNKQLSRMTKKTDEIRTVNEEINNNFIKGVETMRNNLRGILTEMRSANAESRERIEKYLQTINQVGSTLDEKSKKMNRSISEWSNSVKENVKEIKEVTEESTNEIYRNITELRIQMDDINDMFVDGLKSLKDQFAIMKEEMSEMIGELGIEIKGYIDEIKRESSEAIANNREQITRSIEELKGTTETVVNKATEQTSILTAKLNELMTASSAISSNIIGEIATVTDAIGSQIKNITSINQSATNDIQRIFDNTKEEFERIQAATLASSRETAKTIATEAIIRAKEMAEQFAREEAVRVAAEVNQQQLKAAIDSLSAKYNNPEILAAIQEASRIVGSVTDQIQTKATEVVEAGRIDVAEIKQKLDTINEEIRGINNKIQNNLIKAIESKDTDIFQALDQQGVDLNTIYTSIQNRLDEIESRIIERESKERVTNAVMNEIGRLKEYIREYNQEIIQTINEMKEKYTIESGSSGISSESEVQRIEHTASVNKGQIEEIKELIDTISSKLEAKWKKNTKKELEEKIIEIMNQLQELVYTNPEILNVYITLNFLFTYYFAYLEKNTTLNKLNDQDNVIYQFMIDEEEVKLKISRDIFENPELLYELIKRNPIEYLSSIINYLINKLYMNIPDLEEILTDLNEIIEEFNKRVKIANIEGGGKTKKIIKKQKAGTKTSINPHPDTNPNPNKSWNKRNIKLYNILSIRKYVESGLLESIIPSVTASTNIKTIEDNLYNIEFVESVKKIFNKKKKQYNGVMSNVYKKIDKSQINKDKSLISDYNKVKDIQINMKDLGINEVMQMNLVKVLLKSSIYTTILQYDINKYISNIYKFNIYSNQYQQKSLLQIKDLIDYQLNRQNMNYFYNDVSIILENQYNNNELNDYIKNILLELSYHLLYFNIYNILQIIVKGSLNYNIPIESEDIYNIITNIKHIITIFEKLYQSIEDKTNTIQDIIAQTWLDNLKVVFEIIQKTSNSSITNINNNKINQMNYIIQKLFNDILNVDKYKNIKSNLLIQLLSIFTDNLTTSSIDHLTNGINILIADRYPLTFNKINNLTVLYMNEYLININNTYLSIMVNNFKFKNLFELYLSLYKQNILYYIDRIESFSEFESSINTLQKFKNKIEVTKIENYTKDWENAITNIAKHNPLSVNIEQYYNNIMSVYDEMSKVFNKEFSEDKIKYKNQLKKVLTAIYLNYFNNAGYGMNIIKKYYQISRNINKNYIIMDKLSNYYNSVNTSQYYIYYVINMLIYCFTVCKLDYNIYLERGINITIETSTAYNHKPNYEQYKNVYSILSEVFKYALKTSNNNIKNIIEYGNSNDITLNDCLEYNQQQNNNNIELIKSYMNSNILIYHDMMSYSVYIEERLINERYLKIHENLDKIEKNFEEFCESNSISRDPKYNLHLENLKENILDMFNKVSILPTIILPVKNKLNNQLILEGVELFQSDITDIIKSIIIYNKYINSLVIIINNINNDANISDEVKTKIRDRFIRTVEENSKTSIILFYNILYNYFLLYYFTVFKMIETNTNEEVIKMKESDEYKQIRDKIKEYTDSIKKILDEYFNEMNANNLDIYKKIKITKRNNENAVTNPINQVFNDTNRFNIQQINDENMMNVMLNENINNLEPEIESIKRIIVEVMDHSKLEVKQDIDNNMNIQSMQINSSNNLTNLLHLNINVFSLINEYTNENINDYLLLKDYIISEIREIVKLQILLQTNISKEEQEKYEQELTYINQKIREYKENITDINSHIDKLDKNSPNYQQLMDEKLKNINIYNEFISKLQEDKNKIQSDHDEKMRKLNDSKQRIDILNPIFDSPIMTGGSNNSNIAIINQDNYLNTFEDKLNKLDSISEMIENIRENQDQLKLKLKKIEEEKKQEIELRLKKLENISEIEESNLGQVPIVEPSISRVIEEPIEEKKLKMIKERQIIMNVTKLNDKINNMIILGNKIEEIYQKIIKLKQEIAKYNIETLKNPKFKDIQKIISILPIIKEEIDKQYLNYLQNLESMSIEDLNIYEDTFRGIDDQTESIKERLEKTEKDMIKLVTIYNIQYLLLENIQSIVRNKMIKERQNMSNIQGNTLDIMNRQIKEKYDLFMEGYSKIMNEGNVEALNRMLLILTGLNDLEDLEQKEKMFNRMINVQMNQPSVTVPLKPANVSVTGSNEPLNPANAPLNSPNEPLVISSSTTN